MIKTKYPYNVEILNKIKEDVLYEGLNCSDQCKYLNKEKGLCNLFNETLFYFHSRNRFCFTLFSDYKKRAIDQIYSILNETRRNQPTCPRSCGYLQKGKKGRSCKLFNEKLEKSLKHKDCIPLFKDSYA